MTNNVRHIGVNDEKITLFEGQYPVQKGMAYNSYVILDEKIAVFDTVEKGFFNEWLENLKAQLNGKAPDYLIVSHVEPDHSSNIVNFMNEYKNAVIVGNAKTFTFINNFYGTDFADRRLIVKEGDTLCLGEHTLSFILAPMIHWPEVMMTYDTTDKILFSADAFGKFGTTDAEEEWTEEARRYYIGIVGKYGAQVQAVLKKAANLEIKTICPLHGPILTENLGKYISLYNTWSSFSPETEGVFIAYTSIYGNTLNAVTALRDELTAKGIKVEIFDLARGDIKQAVAKAFEYSKLVLATTTYNGTIFPAMREFIDNLTERGYQNRKIGFIENGSWAPVAARKMKEALEGGKNITIAETVVTLLSAFTAKNAEQVKLLANELI